MECVILGLATWCVILGLAMGCVILGLAMGCVILGLARASVAFCSSWLFGHRSRETYVAMKLLSQARRGAGKFTAKKQIAKKKQTMKPSGKSFQPVVCKQGTVVSGGFLKAPVFLPTLEFQGESWVKLHIREPWLCRLVAGKATGLDPLKRTSLIEDLSRAVDGHVRVMPQPAGVKGPSPKSTSAPAEIAPPAGSMRGFGLDDMAEGRAQERIPHPRNSRRPDVKSKKTEPPKMLVVSLPAGAQEKLPSLLRGKQSTFRTLSRAPGQTSFKSTVWVHLCEINWILEGLHRELLDGGVNFQPRETTLGVYYNLRDSLWQARAKDPSGQVYRKCFNVRKWSCTSDGRRRVLLPDEFAKIKEEVFQQAQEWMEQVRDGAAV